MDANFTAKMGSYCISHLAILALSALFCHAEDCQIQCCEHPPCKEKPCGTYDATCYGFVGCSLPEECICDICDRSEICDDPCRIIKSIGGFLLSFRG